ncbi:MAG: DMT family transporter [Armatimonadetes bacterium]|nr:DMT family transporter [Armatimonadota bacterium]
MPSGSRINWPLLITMLLWGYNFVAVKFVYHEISPAAVSMARFVVMYAVLLVVCRIQKTPISVDREDRLSILGVGFLSMGIYMIFFLEGMSKSTPAQGAIILACAPIMTNVFAVLAKQERFCLGAFIGALVSFAGVSAVVLKEGFKPGFGDILLLLSSAVWSFQAVWSRPYLRKYSSLQLLTASLPGALIPLLPYALLPTLHTNWEGIGFWGWLNFFHVSVLSGAVGFLGFYMGVRQIGASRAMLYQFLVPPMAATFGYLALKMPLEPLQLVGFVLVVAGIVWANRARESAAVAVAATA